MSSAKEEYRQHSRSSSDTHTPDLEKGEARPDKAEEEVFQEKVCISQFCATIISSSSDQCLFAFMVPHSGSVMTCARLEDGSCNT